MPSWIFRFYREFANETTSASLAGPEGQRGKIDCERRGWINQNDRETQCSKKPLSKHNAALKTWQFSGAYCWFCLNACARVCVCVCAVSHTLLSDNNWPEITLITATGIIAGQPGSWRCRQESTAITSACSYTHISKLTHTEINAVNGHNDSLCPWLANNSILEYWLLSGGNQQTRASFDLLTQRRVCAILYAYNYVAVRQRCLLLLLLLLVLLLPVAVDCLQLTMLSYTTINAVWVAE